MTRPRTGATGTGFFSTVRRAARARMAQLQPLVPPQVLHFMQVPLRTSV